MPIDTIKIQTDNNIFDSLNKDCLKKEYPALDPKTLLIQEKSAPTFKIALRKYDKENQCEGAFLKIDSLDRVTIEYSAKVLGATIVDEYSNRSFLVKRTKGIGQNKAGSWNQYKNKFRKKKKNSNIFVEKSKHAIDSFNEKNEIPFEAKRQKTRWF